MTIFICFFSSQFFLKKASEVNKDLLWLTKIYFGILQCMDIIGHRACFEHGEHRVIGIMHILLHPFLRICITVHIFLFMFQKHYYWELLSTCHLWRGVLTCPYYTSSPSLHCRGFHGGKGEVNDA